MQPELKLFYGLGSSDNVFFCALRGKTRHNVIGQILWHPIGWDILIDFSEVVQRTSRCECFEREPRESWSTSRDLNAREVQHKSEQCAVD